MRLQHFGVDNVQLHQHFFATCMDSREERQSKACRRFVSILRNWGNQDNKHVIETVYRAISIPATGDEDAVLRRFCRREQRND